MIARFAGVLGGVGILLWYLPGYAVASCHRGVTYTAGGTALGCGEVAATASAITVGLVLAAVAALSGVASRAGATPGVDAEAGASGGEAGSGAGRRQDATPAASRPKAGDPVDLSTGEMVRSEIDVDLPGVLGLVLRRTHVSSYRAGRVFGPSWASTLDERLELGPAGVTYLTEDGMRLRYPSGSGQAPVLPVAGPRWPLSPTGDGGYVVARPEAGQQSWFGPGGNVRPLVAVTDLAGHRIDVQRDSAGVPTELLHSGGYRVLVQSDRGRVTAFGLARQGDRPTTLVRYRYDAEGRLVEVIDSTDRPVRYSYDHAGRVTRWEDRIGQWYAYVYDDRGRVTRTESSGNVLTGSFDYGEQWTVFTNSLGHATTYRFNGAGQLVREIDPQGGTTVSEWDAYDRLLTRTDPLGRTTTYEYDDAGNLTTLTRPDGSQLHAEHDRLGSPTRVTDADGASWHYSYDERGRLLAATDPVGATTRYGYDARGHVTSITDALGNTRHLECDAAGLPVAVTDELGATTSYRRDECGRVVEITDPAGATTRLAWTPEGDLLSQTFPDGSSESWRYDAQGNEVEHVDAGGQVTRTEITAFDLPAAIVEPDGARTQFRYDTELRLVAVTDPRGLTWSYEYDSVGNLVRETDVNGRTLTYEYDPAGQLTARTNGEGETVEYVRNAVGDVVQQRDGTMVTDFEYGPTGRLLRAVNAHADVTFQYDQVGRVVAETVNGRSLASRYDLLGRRTGRRSPAGVESTWQFAATGLLAQLHVAGRSLQFGHDSAGREVLRQLGNGTVLRQGWDAVDRLESQILNRSGDAAMRRRMRYRPDGHVDAVEDDLWGTRHLDLDPVGRVCAVRTRAWQERYAYDAAGCVVDASWPASDTEAQGPRDYSGTLISRAGNVRYEHDRQGRLVARTRHHPSGGSSTWRYTWDATDQLVGVTTPDSTRWAYLYDPFGRRIAKLRLDAGGNPVEWTTFTWDGWMLAEATHSTGGTTTWEHHPGDSRPLVQIEHGHASGQRFFALVTDAIGTPTELVDDAGALAWRARNTLWGLVPDGDRQQADTPLRFPGQYYDPESELSYNYFRYYDAAAARYCSADPLGVGGGRDPHAYVANPNTSADPLALRRQDKPGFDLRYDPLLDPLERLYLYIPSLRHRGRSMTRRSPGEVVQELAKALKTNALKPTKALVSEPKPVNAVSAADVWTPGNEVLGITLVVVGAWQLWKRRRASRRSSGCS